MDGYQLQLLRNGFLQRLVQSYMVTTCQDYSLLDYGRFFLSWLIQAAYKHQLELDEKKKKALDKHIEFLLGQTERYSTMLAENLVNSPTPYKPPQSGRWKQLSQQDKSILSSEWKLSAREFILALFAVENRVSALRCLYKCAVCVKKNH